MSYSNRAAARRARSRANSARQRQLITDPIAHDSRLFVYKGVTVSFVLKVQANAKSRYTVLYCPTCKHIVGESNDAIVQHIERAHMPAADPAETEVFEPVEEVA